MKRDDFVILLTRFASAHVQPPATTEVVLAAERTLGWRLPEGYRRFVLSIANGAKLDRLTLLPLSEGGDSLQRANDPSQTSWFDGDEATLSEFCVFATMGSACFALPVEADADAPVWMWERGRESLLELDYDFTDFLLVSADDLPG